MAKFTRGKKILNMINPNMSPSQDNNNEEYNEVQNKESEPVEVEIECMVPCQTTRQSLQESNQLCTTKSLVADYASDITLSDNEGNITKGAAEIAQATKASSRSSSSTSSGSSCSGSSCSGSTSSSSSESGSDNENSSSIPQANHCENIVTVDESTSDDVIENTPPHQSSTLNMEKYIHPLRERQQTQNYEISPLYTDESDVDLSDTDPTFMAIEPRVRNYIFNESSTDSSDLDQDETFPPKKGRKRPRNPLKWKQNKIKHKRNTGQSYVSSSKSKKHVPARCLKEPCTEKCRLKCSEIIDTNQRYEIFSQFWGLGDLAKQRAYLNSCMMDITPKYKYSNVETPRRSNAAFYLTILQKKVRVCKTFFKSTLDISDRMIFTVRSKLSENGFVLDDLRGKHQNHLKIDSDLRNAIKSHINAIPRIESHYLRASTSKEYIDGSKTIRDLYKDFKLEQQENNKKTGTYMNYYKIFTNEFNLGFFQPKKDQCDQCNAYYNSSVDQKLALEEKYTIHIEEKNLSRIEKINDRKKINKNIKVVVYDLEAVLQCPKGDTSSFYYKSKLNCYNLTLTELTQKECKAAYDNVHCYFWSESDAKRGAVEIGSCVWKYLEAICEEDSDEKEVIFYSDNCCGQNKNKYVACLYLFALQTFNINSITHKFLIRGHTQNEADSVHSLIEKEIKKNLKFGPIYTPDQYIALIKNAKKTQPPLRVHALTYESFYDLKKLQEEWGYNFTTNTQGQSVNWNDIKVLKMTKDNTTRFFYKTSYMEETYKEVNIRNKRKKMNPTNQISLTPAYTSKQILSTNKKKDLRELLSKTLIPTYYAGFYNSIL